MLEAIKHIFIGSYSAIQILNWITETATLSITGYVISELQPFHRINLICGNHGTIHLDSKALPTIWNTTDGMPRFRFKENKLGLADLELLKPHIKHTKKKH